MGGHVHLQGATALQGHTPAEAAQGPQAVQQAGDGAGIAPHLGLILLEVVHFLNHHDGQHHVVFLEVQDRVGVVEKHIRVEDKHLLARWWDQSDLQDSPSLPLRGPGMHDWDSGPV